MQHVMRDSRITFPFRTMVHVFLDVGGSAVPFHSIPLSDVERLSIRPLKQLQFVAFTICGARGDLSLTPGVLHLPMSLSPITILPVVRLLHFWLPAPSNRHLREV
jgi:hypothetical protein